MLTKFLFLLILAYFVYRTVQNLITASLGNEAERRRFQRRSNPGNRAQDIRTTGHAPDPRVSHRPPPEDIEDARWRDL
jgi:hypothetical protein